MCFDTETTGTDPIEAKLVGISFAIEENSAYYVHIPREDEKAQKIVDTLKTIFEDESTTKVGQNMKYDITVLANNGVEVKGKMFDTMIAHYVLQPELYHSMDYMAETYLNYETIKIESLIGARGKGQRNMRDLTAEQIYEYACEAADVTLKLKNILIKIGIFARQKH